jgi:[ribosomal protein S5]-alanine N-acetyltransferase
MMERYMKKIDILIRPLKLKDINSSYIAWFNDMEVTKYLDAKNISVSQSQKYLLSGILQRSYYIYAICDKKTNIHLGNIKVGPIRRFDGVSDLVTVIGDKNFWGKNVASKAIYLVKEKVFLESGIRKFVASIDSLNIASVYAYKKAGFKIETKLSNFFIHKNENKSFYSDKIYITANNDNYNLKTFNKWEPISLEDIK